MESILYRVRDEVSDRWAVTMFGFSLLVSPEHGWMVATFRFGFCTPSPPQFSVKVLILNLLEVKYSKITG
jgi:hypothetical protein